MRSDRITEEFNTTYSVAIEKIKSLYTPGQSSTSPTDNMIYDPLSNSILHIHEEPVAPTYCEINAELLEIPPTLCELPVSLDKELIHTEAVIPLATEMDFFILHNLHCIETYLNLNPQSSTPTEIQTLLNGPLLKHKIRSEVNKHVIESLKQLENPDQTLVDQNGRTGSQDYPSSSSSSLSIFERLTQTASHVSPVSDPIDKLKYTQRLNQQLANKRETLAQECLQIMFKTIIKQAAEYNKKNASQPINCAALLKQVKAIPSEHYESTTVGFGISPIGLNHIKATKNEAQWNSATPFSSHNEHRYKALKTTAILTQSATENSWQIVADSILHRLPAQNATSAASRQESNAEQLSTRSSRKVENIIAKNLLQTKQQIGVYGIQRLIGNRWCVEVSKGKSEPLETDLLRTEMAGLHLANKKLVSQNESYNFETFKEQGLRMSAIPVNGWGCNLTNTDVNYAIPESLYLTQLQILHILDQTLTAQVGIDNQINNAYAAHANDYITKLRSYKGTGLLHKKSSPASLYKYITQCGKTDNHFKQLQTLNTPTNPAEYACNILIKLVQTGHYKKQEWGYLTQAIIAYLETNPVSGCKSANERQTEHQLRLHALCSNPSVLQEIHHQVVTQSNTQAGFDYLTQAVNERGQHWSKQDLTDMAAPRKTTHSPNPKSFWQYFDDLSKSASTNRQSGVSTAYDTWDPKGAKELQKNRAEFIDKALSRDFLIECISLDKTLILYCLNLFMKEKLDNDSYLKTNKAYIQQFEKAVKSLYNQLNKPNGQNAFAKKLKELTNKYLDNIDKQTVENLINNASTLQRSSLVENTRQSITVFNGFNVQVPADRKDEQQKQPTILEPPGKTIKPTKDNHSDQLLRHPPTITY